MSRGGVSRDGARRGWVEYHGGESRVKCICRSVGLNAPWRGSREHGAARCNGCDNGRNVSHIRHTLEAVPRQNSGPVSHTPFPEKLGCQALILSLHFPITIEFEMAFLLRVKFT